MRKKILPIILYSLPILFFVISYFVMTVSGEDIYQGASTAPDIIKDFIGAFRTNSRLSDMYAWAVINFFDYQFSFGVDFIFRLLDVIMAAGIFYIITYLAIGRKPALKTTDAAIFNVSALLFLLSRFGYPLYGGFSMIHNYLIISLSVLLFFCLFVRYFYRKNIKETLPWCIAYLLLGIVFAMSSNLVSIAFIMAITIFYIVQKIRHKPVHVKKWFIFGLIGVLIGMFIAFFIGPGISNYAGSQDYTLSHDYVSFNDIFIHPKSSILRITFHEIRNFASPLLLPGACMLILLALWYFLYKKKLATLPKFSMPERQIIIFGLLFAACYMLTMSQIIAPPRLTIPAYLVVVVVFCIIAKNILTTFKPTFIPKIIYALLILLSLAVLVIHTILLINHHQNISKLLNNISASQEDSVCIKREEMMAKQLPIINLNQEHFLVDWIMPAEIYNKTITFCEE